METSTNLAQMKRRRFIGIAATSAAAAAVPALARQEASVVATLARPRLLGIFHDERVVCDLGRRYRALVPAEDDLEALVQIIVAELPDNVPPHASARTLGVHLDEQVQRDFASGATVTLHGWVLSLTEARQCALFSLMAA